MPHQTEDQTALPGDGLTASETGLTSRQAQERLSRDGANVLPVGGPPSPTAMLLGQLTHFFALMLWVAAALAAVAGLPQLAIAIVVVIVLNGVFAFVQEYRADRAGARLKQLLPVRVTVVRGGEQQMIAAEALVVGDLVILNAGDRVCADLQLRHCDGLAIDESMLTGESVPVRPDVSGSAYAGTFVVEGAGRAVVTAVAGNTRLAGIAMLSRSAGPPKSPLAVELDRVVRIIALVAAGVGVAFFSVALLLGTAPRDGFLFAVGVTVALVPEGLLPTVTLSLARGAQQMAHRNALVRRLESVETLGSTTFVCTDKTGTLTRNEMSVVNVWTPYGSVSLSGSGYEPIGSIDGAAAAVAAMADLAESALYCVIGRVVCRDGRWQAHGDPMDAAIHVLALRCGLKTPAPDAVTRRYPFDPRRRRSSAVARGALHVLGASDSVLPRCVGDVGPDPAAVVADMTASGLRVVAVARRPTPEEHPGLAADEIEQDLRLLGIVGLEDPPREGVEHAVAACRRAGIRLAMVTGDHPGTARAIATEVGLLGPDAIVISGSELPAADAMLGELLERDGVVVARVTPEDKLRITRVLQHRGHVVAMTGDGVNDGPALREADIGVAMGRTGTDVARDASDLVLLDDRFETIVAAVELGRATYSNIRRFLTYHLTDNVAELTPFVIWALTAGSVPLAIGVLQVLALDIGTDLLPALALGAEPPAARVLNGPMRAGRLLDGAVLWRAFGVLGPVEAVVEMASFTAVLIAGGWAWGRAPNTHLLATASGTAFTAVVLGQLANAFACRSQTRPAFMMRWRSNPLLLWALGFELIVLGALLGIAPLARLLGGDLPTTLGWCLAVTAVPAVITADAVQKALLHKKPTE